MTEGNGETNQEFISEYRVLSEETRSLRPQSEHSISQQVAENIHQARAAGPEPHGILQRLAWFGRRRARTSEQPAIAEAGASAQAFAFGPSEVVAKHDREIA